MKTFSSDDGRDTDERTFEIRTGEDDP